MSKQAFAACIDDAVMGAVVRIGRPMVSEYVTRQLGKPVPGKPSRVAAQ